MHTVAQLNDASQGRAGARRWVFFVCVLVLAVGATVATARVQRFRSDPRATLIVSQVILKSGTIELDNLGKAQIERYSIAIQRKGEHLYGYFPLGSSVFALPFVAVLNLLGVDLGTLAGDATGQRTVVAFVSMATVGFLVLIARLFLTPAWAIAVSAVTWFGSSFSSSAATALWSHDFGCLAALCAIYVVLRWRGAMTRVRCAVLGFALFSAYFSRPTFALFVLAALTYLFIHDRVAALMSGAVALACLGAFVMFCYHELHQPLPDYYLPDRLATNEFWLALYGDLLSPARGLLIYSPIFCLPLLFPFATKKALLRDPALTLIAVLWPAIHLIVIAQFPHWWAGFSFGPRLCTDIVPGLFVLLCIVIAEAQRQSLAMLSTAFMVLSVPSCIINTYQGLNNLSTADWNVQPNIDANPQLIFDWRYPQFLHTAARQAQRRREYRHLRTP